jgi:3-oxoacyl-[acyl-carrier protein] reductase
MDAGLAGSRALVVGGGSGIGRAVALALADEGVHLAIASRRPDPATVETIQARGVKAVRIVADAASEPDVVRMVAEAIDQLGGLEMLVWVPAAIMNEPISTMRREAWDAVLATNVTGCASACREAARHFVARLRGGILLVGSSATVSAQPTEAAYRASKAALGALAGVLAVELAPFGVRVNVLTPGAVDTAFVAGASTAQRSHVIGQIPLRREATPDEIAPSAVFLLSDRLSPYTTGAELLVDGGLHLRPLFAGDDEAMRGLNAPR